VLQRQGRLNAVGKEQSEKKLKEMIVEPENAGILYDFPKKNTIDKPYKKVVFQMIQHLNRRSCVNLL
jgi:hypothetical protein